MHENTEYCQYCYKSFKTCSICNKKHPTAKRRYIDNVRDEYVCDHCASKMHTCSKCNSLATKIKRVNGKIKDKILCHICCSDSELGGECPICLTAQRDNNICYHCQDLYTDNNRCRKCDSIMDYEHQCRKCGSSKYKIYNYSKKPQLVFNGKDFKDLFFGIENEQTYEYSESRDRNLSNIYKLFDPTVLFCKSDGSISGPGFELVTQPMTLGFFNELAISSWFTDTRKHSSCGMHIHLCRDSFRTELHIFKFINFIHNNDKLCNLVSGRDYNSYNCKLEKKPSRATKPGSTSRYCRINTSGNSTIEVRMFAGCTSEFEMKYRVEFTHAIWKFYENTSIADKNLLGFISNNRKTYPNIYKFLVAKGEIK